MEPRESLRDSEFLELVKGELLYANEQKYWVRLMYESQDINHVACHFEELFKNFRNLEC